MLSGKVPESFSLPFYVCGSPISQVFLRSKNGPKCEGTDPRVRCVGGLQKVREREWGQPEQVELIEDVPRIVAKPVNMDGFPAAGRLDKSNSPVLFKRES